MTGPRGDEAPEFLPLGKKVEYTVPDEDWRPIPGKPYFWISKDGKMKYTPPEPPWGTPP